MFAAFTDVLIQDAGFTRSLDNVDFAPIDGWSNNGTVELILGHSYVCRLTAFVDHYRYAKFRVVGLSSSPPRVVLDWAYQTAVDNVELGARPASSDGGRVRRPLAWLR
jgi:hypothetical protein